MPHFSPLRYPGGKGKLSQWLFEIMKYNGISNNTYIEPYAGGAGAAFNLLLKNHVSNIFINDIDQAIFHFWKTALYDTDFMLETIEKTPITVDEWHKQRNIYQNQKQYNPSEVGFATFFLNRTSRSGILGGGIIGGKEQRGRYKIDARYNKKNLQEKIKAVARYKYFIRVENFDAAHLLQKETLPAKGLIFIDPPYFNKSRQLYRSHYALKNHREISDIVKSLKTPWIMTYDNCEEIKSLYDGINRIEFSINYSAHNNKKGQEILFYNNIKLPYHP